MPVYLQKLRLQCHRCIKLTEVPSGYNTYRTHTPSVVAKDGEKLLEVPGTGMNVVYETSKF